jgi:hypothetical protein
MQGKGIEKGGPCGFLSGNEKQRGMDPWDVLVGRAAAPLLDCSSEGVD